MAHDLWLDVLAKRWVNELSEKLHMAPETLSSSPRQALSQIIERFTRRYDLSLEPVPVRGENYLHLQALTFARTLGIITHISDNYPSILGHRGEISASRIESLIGTINAGLSHFLFDQEIAYRRREEPRHRYGRDDDCA